MTVHDTRPSAAPAVEGAAEPSDESATGSLRRVAACTPDLEALALDGEITTYAELDRAVDRVAARLIADHGPGHPLVALRIEGSHAMAVASLAVQRAGMANVPIDPTAPDDRVAAVLAEVQPAVLLTDRTNDAAAGWGVRVEQVADYTADPPPGGVVAEPGELAAVVFTSGSTGVPKGIMQSVAARRQMAAMVKALEAEHLEGTTRRMGSVTLGTVGMADGLIHTAILLGGTFVGYDIRRRGLGEWGRWMREERVSATVLVPTIWRYLAPTLAPDETFPDLLQVIMIGEASTWDDVRALDRHLSSRAVISNYLGQTEVMISRFDITQDVPRGEGRLPAGRPMAGREVVIVDESGRPVAPGEDGEITVTTTTAALGYWNMPEATARTFERRPDGRTCVRTGDAGRLLPDGSLQHLGRIDHMVKISGNRVELGEVETALRACAGLADAAVVTYASTHAGLRLRAFVVGEPGVAVDTEAVRRHLADRLPRSYLPDLVEVVDELPLLAGGKVDRRELSSRPRPASEATGVIDDPYAEVVADLFAEVLELPRVGIDDDFFALGGDSLRAARLFTELGERLGVQAPVSMIFQAATVASLAPLLRRDAAWEPLVTVREGAADKAPLVVVHDGFGDVLYAHRVGQHVAADRPVLGLRSRTVLGLPPEDAELVEVAGRYVRALREVRPTGPYLLYGWSLGGTLAFEMAVQLQAAGEEIAMLALGDSPGPVPELDGAAYDLRARARRRWHQVAAERPDRAVLLAGRLAARQVRPAALTAYDRVSRRLGWRPEADDTRLAAIAVGEAVPADLRQAYSLRCYGSMLLRYVPTGTFDGSVLLVRAQGGDERPDRGWSPWVSGDVDVVAIDTHHGEPWQGTAGQVHLEALRAASAAAP